MPEHATSLVGLLPMFVLAPLIVLGIYLVFGRGLALRIFSAVTPIVLVIGVTSHLIGGYGLTWFTGLVLIPIATAVALGCLVWLYRVVVKALRNYTSDLAASSAQLAATANQSAATASQQASLVSEVTATIDELRMTSTATARSAKDVVEVASLAMERSREGLDAVVEALRIMELIGQTASIVDTVAELAEQSNLLAVNASIEAAKAGEHGRGFAVVAAEVRSLAEQSKAATRQIHEALQRTDEGRLAMESVNAIIEQLVGVLDDAAGRARSISGASQQQAAGVEEISEAMASVSQGGADAASAAIQIQEAVGSLDSLGQGLRDFIGGNQALEAAETPGENP